MSAINHEAAAVEALRSVPGDVSPELAVQVAQAAATLALVEQQRIANIIALGRYRIGPNELPPFRHLVVEPRGDIDIAVHAEIREALRLRAGGAA